MCYFASDKEPQSSFVGMTIEAITLVKQTTQKLKHQFLMDGLFISHAISSPTVDNS